MNFMDSSKSFGIFASFLVGMFYASIFTAAIALALLADLSQTTPWYEVIFMAGLGCTVGDFILLRFIKDKFSDDFLSVLEDKFGNVWKKSDRYNYLKVVSFMVGAIVVASPLPDEIGLAFMGVSGVHAKYFLPVTFVLNLIGITCIYLLAR